MSDSGKQHIDLFERKKRDLYLKASFFTPSMENKCKWTCINKHLSLTTTLAYSWLLYLFECQSQLSRCHFHQSWHFMWVLCLADNAHEMSWLIFLKKKKKNRMGSAANLLGILRVNTGFIVYFFFQVFFGTMQARNALSANSVGINCSTGMSSLVRKQIVEAAGGLAAFSKYLAEDHFIATETTKQ